MSSPQQVTVQISTVSICPNVDFGKQNIGSFIMKIWSSLCVIIEDLILLITFNGKIAKQFVSYICVFVPKINFAKFEMKDFFA